MVRPPGQTMAFKLLEVHEFAAYLNVGDKKYGGISSLSELAEKLPEVKESPDIQFVS